MTYFDQAEASIHLGVVVVLVVIFLGLPGRVHRDGVSAVLAAAGNVIPAKDPKNAQFQLGTTNVKL